MRAKYRLEAYATLRRRVVDVGAREHQQHVYVSARPHGAISSIRIRAVPLWEFNQEKIDAN
jgi:hypothetical protein